MKGKNKRVFTIEKQLLHYEIQQMSFIPLSMELK